MKNELLYALTCGMGAVLRLLPRRLRLDVGRALGSLFYALDRRHRKRTLDNVELALGGEKSAREKSAIAAGAFRHFGAMFVEMVTLGRPTADDLEQLVELEGVERFLEAQKRGKGVILVTAHLGNWELHAIAHGFRLGRIHVVAREQDNPYLNRWLESIRKISGNEVIYKERALGQMRRLLKAGETVAVVIDQNVHRDQAVFVDFFGTKAATTPIASWFALKTGAALVPAFSFPLGDSRYRAVYERAVDCAPFQDMDRDEALAALTQELARVQERYIRAHPHCWLWMHHRWRTRPPGESGADRVPVEPAARGVALPESR